ncbi:MAG: ATP-binding protein [Bacteroidota bacterium]
MLGLFMAQDALVLGLPDAWIWRVVGIIPLFAFLFLSFWIPDRKTDWAIPFNALILFGILLMMAGLCYQVFSSPITSLLHRSAVIAGLLTVMVACLIIASGARPQLTWMVPGILAVLSIALYLEGNQTEDTWSFLSNAYIIGILVVVFSRLQERTVFREFSNRYQLARQEVILAQQKSALERANSELEAYNYTVTHDLRNPLRGVIGSATLLMRRHKDEMSEDGQKWLAQIMSNASRMNELINDILRFAKLEREVIEGVSIDMTNLFRDAYHDIVEEADRKAIQMNIHPMRPALADASLIQQVANNLLSNAIKFSSKSEQPKIEVSGITFDDGTYAYMVRDNGIGFDPQDSEKLFTFFKRLHSQHDYSGTGVGLAFVKRILERHNGKIWADSKPGQGASFYFTLPAADNQPVTTAHPIADS